MPGSVEIITAPTSTHSGFAILEDHTTFSILQDGKVLAEPEDGESYIVDPKEYPQDIKDEFERRQQGEVIPTFIENLRKRTEAKAIYFNLRKQKSIPDFYEHVLKTLFQKAADDGANSYTLRFALSEDGSSTLPHEKAESLRLLLKSEGFKRSIGNYYSREGEGLSAVRIHWTISWLT